MSKALGWTFVKSLRSNAALNPPETPSDRTVRRSRGRRCRRSRRGGRPAVPPRAPTAAPRAAALRARRSRARPRPLRPERCSWQRPCPWRLTSPSHSGRASTVHAVTSACTCRLRGPSTGAPTRYAAAYTSSRRASSSAHTTSPVRAYGAVVAARASSVGTATTSASTARAHPLAVLTPMRSPVYEPGPSDTATTSIASRSTSACSSTASIMGVSRRACIRGTCRCTSARTLPSTHTATPQVSVAVSIARIVIDQRIEG